MTAAHGDALRQGLAALTLAAALALPAPAARAEPGGVVAVSRAMLEAGEPLVDGWRYRPGDDPARAAPELDDSGWEVADPRLAGDDLPEAGWPGIGWFRLRLRLDADLEDAAVTFEVRQEGASEVYLDGRRLAAFGKVGGSRDDEEAYWFPEPRILDLEPGRVHLVAVRYSNHAGHRKLGGEGFRFVLCHLDATLARREGLMLGETQEAMFLSGAGAAFAVLHLMLFLFFPQARANLYYALLTAAIAGLYWTDQRAMFLHDPARVAAWFKGTVTFGIALPLLAVLVVLSAFGRRIPVHFYVLAAIGAALVAWCWLRPGWPAELPLYFVFGGVVYLETLRILGLEIYRRQSRGAWVIGLGFAFFVVVAYAPALGLAFDPRVATSLGLLGLLISISVYLAMGVAKTKRDLEARIEEVRELDRIALEREREKQRIETERRLLEAENRRQAEELEAARKLQLSMLPARRPEHAHLDVAFAMWTAAEVGGDYYDYRLDGEALTLAVGDATGHGLDSGLVVVATKSIFQTPPVDSGVTEILERVSRGIRRLGLERMFMALALVRCEGRTLRLASAGMPPALVFRAADATVEEILLPGPPLGTFAGVRYQEKEVTLGPGDAFLLMTDGLPELASPQGDLLGYEKVRALYAEVAAEPPEQVVERLYEAAREFAAGRMLEDDLTLVALRGR